MNTIMRYRPVNDLSRVRRNMDGLFNEFFRSAFGDADLNESGATWMPHVDLSETNEAFMIAVDLPGMKKSDVEVSFENGTLQISGERKEEFVDEKPQFHRIERVHGRFFRSFELGTAVQSGKIKASFENGVLSIEVPKAEEVKPVRVQIA